MRQDEAMADRKRSRPAWTQADSDVAGVPDHAADREGSIGSFGQELADLWSYTGSGATAGRGFHYQEAVSAWLAASVFARRLDADRLVPEGYEDVSLEGADDWYIQIKSRQRRKGDFGNTEAANDVVTAWVAHRERESLGRGGRLAVVFERPIGGESFLGWGVALSDSAAKSHPFITSVSERARLLGYSDPEINEMVASVCVVVLDWERLAGETVDAIVTRLAIPRAGAAIVSRMLRGAVADGSDLNAEHGVNLRATLSRNDIESLVLRTAELIDSSSLGQAITDGICEPVDFRQPESPPQFYEGCDVQPAHVSAGLVQPRPALNTQIADALADTRSVLVTGPSGMGKSALVWSAVHTTQRVLWFRVWRLQAGDIEPLMRLARAAAPTVDTPVGFVVDAIGRSDIQAWDELQRRVQATPGLLLLGSAREEDLILVRTAADCARVPVSLDEDLAARIHKGLVDSGASVAPHWRQAYEQCGGLTLEYAYLLARGRRLSEVIGEQISARVADARDTELEVLALASVADRWGASLSLTQLRRHIGVSAPEMNRALRRLNDELLLREQGGRITGLHQLRSAAIATAVHALDTPALSDSIGTVLDIADEDQLRTFIAGVMFDHPELDETVIDRIVARLSAGGDASAAADLLQGLRIVDFRRAVTTWPEILSRNVPPSLQVTTIRCAVTSLESFQGMRDDVSAALADIASEDHSHEQPLRNEALRRIGPNRIAALVWDTPLYAAAVRLLGVMRDCPADIVDGIAAAVTTSSDLVKILQDSELDAIAAVMGSARSASMPFAERLLDVLGGRDVMLDRFRRTYMWAYILHVARVDTESVAVMRLMYIDDEAMASESYAKDVAALLLACLPECDRCDIVTTWAEGVPVRIGDFPIGVSGLLRRYAYTSTDVSWNRMRIRIAAAMVGSQDLPSWLQAAQDILDELASNVDNLVRLWLYGPHASNEPTTIVNRCLAVAQRAEQINASHAVKHEYETADDEGELVDTEPLSRLAAALMANLPKRLAEPEQWISLGAYVDDTVPKLIEEMRAQRWELIGLAEPPPALDRVSKTVRDLRDVLRSLGRGLQSLNDLRAVARAGTADRALRRAAVSARQELHNHAEQASSQMTQSVAAIGRRTRVLSRRPHGHTMQETEYAIIVHLDHLDEWFQALDELNSVLANRAQGATFLLVPFRNGRPVRGLAMQFILSLLPGTESFGRWADALPAPHATPMADAFALARTSIRALSAIGEVSRHRDLLDTHRTVAEAMAARLQEALPGLGLGTGRASEVRGAMEHLGRLTRRLQEEQEGTADVPETVAAEIGRGSSGEETDELLMYLTALIEAYEVDISRADEPAD